MGVLIHFGELTLKGRNRSSFVDKLVENIFSKTNYTIKKYRDRLFVEGGDIEKIKNVFGISWFAEAEIVEKNVDKIVSYIESYIINNISETATFGLFIKRSDKQFEFNSQKLAEIIGSQIQDKFNLKVDLSNPDLTIYIEIADDVFVFFNKLKGLGGMPSGVAGKILGLLSGGIDSPVASYLMMKRGCEVDYLHFHTFRVNEQAIESKITELVRKLGKYQSDSKIYFVPYSFFQSSLLSKTISRGYELILFRRFMARFAEKLAKIKNYKALCTGDSLSQVASQTIENLNTAYNKMSLPLFQPLISFDKGEIIKISKDIGTYETSILPYNECCSLVSKSPKTKTRIELVNKYELRIGMDEIIYRSLDNMKEYKLS